MNYVGNKVLHKMPKYGEGIIESQDEISIYVRFFATDKIVRFKPPACFEGIYSN